MGVKTIHEHSGYDSVTIDMDFAILELSENLTFNDQGCNSIDILEYSPYPTLIMFGALRNFSTSSSLAPLLR